MNDENLSLTDEDLTGFGRAIFGYVALLIIGVGSFGLLLGVL